MGKCVSSVSQRGSHRTEGGAALITALLLLALATTAAVGLAHLQKREIRRTQNLIYHDRALAMAGSGEQWAMGILRRHEELAKINDWQKPWSIALPTTTVVDGVAKGHLDDLQSRFNLNNLANNGAVDVIALQRCQRLFTLAGVATDLLETVLLRLGVNPLINNTLVMKGGQPRQGEQPVAASPMRFFSVDELLTLPGWDAAVLAQVAPMLTALPATGVPVNVNTASQQVLMALGDGLNPIGAATLMGARQMARFATTGDFVSHPAMAGRNVSEVGLTVSSQFFLVVMESRVGDMRVLLQSLLARFGERVEVLARREGYW